MVANEWIRHADNNLLEFLERMDVVSDGSIAEDMLYAFLDTRADIVKSIKLDGNFTKNEINAFSITYFSFCRSILGKPFNGKLTNGQSTDQVPQIQSSKFNFCIVLGNLLINLLE